MTSYIVTVQTNYHGPVKVAATLDSRDQPILVTLDGVTQEEWNHNRDLIPPTIKPADCVGGIKTWIEAYKKSEDCS